MWAALLLYPVSHVEVTGQGPHPHTQGFCLCLEILPVAPREAGHPSVRDSTGPVLPCPLPLGSR